MTKFYEAAYLFTQNPTALNMAYYSAFIKSIETKIIYQHNAKSFCSRNTFKYQFPGFSHSAKTARHSIYNQHFISLGKL